MLKKWLIRLSLIILSLMGLAALSVFLLSEPLPGGNPGEEADQLAEKMQETVHHEQWLATGAVSWTYAGRHHFLWDRQRHYVIVEWDEYRAIIDLDRIEGVAFKAGARLAGNEAKEIIDVACRYWINDSFWLNPIAKLFDDGVTRQLINLPGNEQGLLVTYGKGGVTPGDAYLWRTDAYFLPSSWQMWVDILPIGGLQVSWESWEHLDTGALISTMHKIGPLTIEITDLKAANTLRVLLGINTPDPFSLLENH